MSEPSPYNNISISEGGRFVRYEWDVHYLTDEQLETLRKHVETLQTENAKLLELVRDYERCTMHADCDKCEYDGKLSTHCPLSPCFPDTDELRELGVEV